MAATTDRFITLLLILCLLICPAALADDEGSESDVDEDVKLTLTVSGGVLNDDGVYVVTVAKGVTSVTVKWTCS